jgi:hypothetical protein
MSHRLRYGHAPGHVRDTFISAIEAFIGWNGEGEEPTVEFEVNYVPRQISLTKACGLVWNCTDIMPGTYFDWLADYVDAKRRTYAACARAMMHELRK